MTAFAIGFIGSWLALSLMVLAYRALRNRARIRAHIRRRLNQPPVKATITSAKPIVRPTSASPILTISADPFVMLRQ